VEAHESAGVLVVGKDRLDHRGAFAVEPAAGFVSEDSAHPSIHVTGPARTAALSVARVGRAEHLHPAADDRRRLHETEFVRPGSSLRLIKVESLIED
jgi:hypothetical protein